MRHRPSGLELFTNVMFNLMFAWPFKFIRWCFRKIRDKRYDIDFSDYPDDDWDEDDFDDIVTLVTVMDSDPENMCISIESDLGLALKGKTIGDVVEVIAPEDKYTVEILEIL